MAVAVWLLAALAAGCDGGTPVSAPDAGFVDATAGCHCGPGLKPHETACMPILDDCPDNHVPVPGGGCERVGLEQCDGGIKGPPDWTCRRVGPPASCPKGWVAGKQGCEPILPTAPCPDDEMEVIGKSTCQPLPCRSIAVTAKTRFVDAAFSGAKADGSQAKPFPTIGQALAAAGRDGHVVVAAGTYPENLTIAQPMRIEGCAKSVIVVGQKQQAAVTVTAPGVELRGLTVTGPQVGVGVAAGAEVKLEEVVVRDCGLPGVVAEAGAELSVAGSLFADNAIGGIFAHDASLTVERSVVRGSTLLVDVPVGHAGIAISGDTTTPSATVRDSVVTGNALTGVAGANALLTVERTVVRDVVPPDADQAKAMCSARPPEQRYPGCESDFQNLGQGVSLGRFRAKGALMPQLTLRESLVADVPLHGVVVSSAAGTIEASVIRGVQQVVPSSYLANGGGVAAVRQGPDDPEATLLISDSLVVGNSPVGVALAGAAVTLERVLVQDNGGSYWGFGGGIFASKLESADVPHHSTVTLRDSVVTGNRGNGIHLYGAEASLVRSAVVDTLGHELNQMEGRGIQALSDGNEPSTLALRDCLVARNRKYGIELRDTDVVVERTVVRDTQAELPLNDDGFGLRCVHGGVHQPTLVLRRSLIQDNRATGVELGGVKAVVERTVVQGTQPVKENGLWGEGIYGTVAHGQPTVLTLEDSVIASNHTTGLLLLSSSATVRRSVMRQTRAEAAFGSFGDGIAVGLAAADTPASIQLSDSLVEDSARAGLLLVGASGAVDRSVFRGGTFGIALEQGADPTLGGCNVSEGNDENRVSFGLNLTAPGGLQLPPAP